MNVTMSFVDDLGLSSIKLRSDLFSLRLLCQWCFDHGTNDMPKEFEFFSCALENCINSMDIISSHVYDLYSSLGASVDDMLTYGEH